MKVLVTGVTGQLGYDVASELSRRSIEHKGVGSKDMDLTDAKQVEEVIRSYHSDVIIHCAAYTAVDRAEDDSATCMAVNADWTLAIAKAAKDIDAKMVYISTDYVFGGEGNLPFAVDAEKFSVNMYGMTKLFGEQAVQMLLRKYFIIRIS